MAYKDYQFKAPTAPALYFPTPGSTIDSTETSFIWHVGTYVIEQYRFVISSEINGHLPGFTPTDEQSLISYNTIQGNIRLVPQIPQGYAPLYVNLFYTVDGTEFHLQYLYNTKPLGIIDPLDNSTIGSESVPVSWVPANPGDHYTLEVEFVNNPGVIIYEAGPTKSTSAVIPASVPRSSGQWLITVNYIERNFTDSVTVTPLASEIPLFPIGFTAWDSISETITYHTEVNTYRDGTEARYGASPTFKQVIDVSIPVTNLGIQKLFHRLKRTGESRYILPFWHQSLECLSRSGATFSFDSLQGVMYKQYSVGQQVILWNSDDDFLITFVVNRTNTTLQVASVSKNYIRIAPIFVARATLSKGGTVQQAGLVDYSMSFLVDTSVLDITYTANQNGSNPSWLLNNDAMSYIPSDISVNYSQIKTKLASRTTEQTNLEGREAQMTVSYTLHMVSAKEISQLVHFLTTLRGRAGEFIQPISTELLRPISLVGTELTIEDSGSTMPDLRVEEARYVIIAGHGAYKVLNISVVGQGYQLTLENPPGFPDIDKCKVTLGFRCRLSSDATTLTYFDNTLATVEIKVIEVLEDV